MWIGTMNKIEMLVNLRLIIKNLSHLRTQWLYKKEIIYITGNQKMVAEKYNNEEIAILLLILGTGLITYYFW